MVPAGYATDDDIRRIVRWWLTAVVAKPDRRLGRAGGVCPVVRRALSAGTVDIAVLRLGSQPSEDELQGVVHFAIEDLNRSKFEYSQLHLRSLIVALPGLSPAAAASLDHLHARMKDVVVRSGMMFAQFYPTCDVRSVRNPELVVGVSPLPMLVFRFMAAHDILFLSERRDWFEAYLSRFGDVLASDSVERFTAEVFHRARMQFGSHSLKERRDGQR